MPFKEACPLCVNSANRLEEGYSKKESGNRRGSRRCRITRQRPLRGWGRRNRPPSSCSGTNGRALVRTFCAATSTNPRSKLMFPQCRRANSETRAPRNAAHASVPQAVRCNDAFEFEFIAARCLRRKWDAKGIWSIGWSGERKIVRLQSRHIFGRERDEGAEQGRERKQHDAPAGFHAVAGSLAGRVARGRPDSRSGGEAGDFQCERVLAGRVRRELDNQPALVVFPREPSAMSE